MTTTKPKKAAAKSASNANVPVVKTPRGDKTDAQVLAEIAYSPLARSLAGARKFIASVAGEQPVTESLEALVAQVTEVLSGDLGIAERTLVAQANTLDAIFNELARRSGLNMGEYMDASERYMRLALKAQSQCRATLETLAAIKNPPVIYAKQANVTSGPQQINNGIAAPSQAGKNEIEPNKLLEARHGNYVDGGTADATSGIDSQMATLGEIDRAEVAGG
jgi:hypothetical protein